MSAITLVTDSKSKNYNIGDATVKLWARFTTATFSKNTLRSYGGPVHTLVYELPIRGSGIKELSSSATKFKESLEYVIQSDTDLELRDTAGLSLAPGVVRALGPVEERTFLNTRGRLADGWARVAATVRRQCVISLDLSGLDKSVRDALTAGLEVGVPKTIGGIFTVASLSGGTWIGAAAALDATGDSRRIRAKGFFRATGEACRPGRSIGGRAHGERPHQGHWRGDAGNGMAFSTQDEIVQLKLLPLSRLSGLIPDGTVADYQAIRDKHVRLLKANRELADLTELLADIRLGNIEADLFNLEKAEQARVAAVNAVVAVEALPLKNAIAAPQFSEAEEKLGRFEATLKELNGCGVKVSVNMQLDLPAITPKPIDLPPGNVRARAVLSFPKIEGDRLAIRRGLDGTAS